MALPRKRMEGMIQLTFVLKQFLYLHSFKFLFLRENPFLIYPILKPSFYLGYSHSY